jgi:hypothetical protein
MRKASGRTRPFTTRAATLILFELQRIKDAGHCPNAALDQSTRHGWADVYPPKDKPIERKASAGTGELEKLAATREQWEQNKPDPSKVRSIVEGLKGRIYGRA